MILNVAIWSMQLLFCLRPACSSLRILSNACFIMFSIIRLRTLLAVVRSVIPPHFSKLLGSLFFANLTSRPFFRSDGKRSWFHIVFSKSYKYSIISFPPAFNASDGISSIPADFPYLRDVLNILIVNHVHEIV